MYKDIEDLVKLYFPGFTIQVSRINDKTYIVVENFVSYTLHESGKTIEIVEVQLCEVKENMYLTQSIGIEADTLYAMHAIINVIILFRKSYDVERISSKNKYFNMYIRKTFENYIVEDVINIQTLLNCESEKFPYINTGYKVYSTNKNRIGFNVAYYPIKVVLDNHRDFSIMGLVSPFSPNLQNARVVIHLINLRVFDFHENILIELLKYANLSNYKCMNIIDTYIHNVDSQMISSIPLFKYFNEYIVNKYNLMNSGFVEEISKMSGISQEFINANYRALKPYRMNILMDEYCPLEYIDKNRWFVSRNKLWGRILTHNKNMTRDFLIKNIRKYPNALIPRMNILEPGDESIFMRYRKRIDWDLFYREFKGSRLDVYKLFIASNGLIDNHTISYLINAQKDLNM